MDLSDRVFLVHTFECRTAKYPPIEDAPRNNAFGIRSFEFFLKLIEARRLPTDVFSTPDFARSCPDALAAAEAVGCRMGLLCQPQAEGYTNFLGGFQYDQQREVLCAARERWEKAAGKPTSSLRASHFSANDYTFSIAVFEGFRHGSCSMSQRMDVAQKSVWRNAPAHGHHTDPLDRNCAGTLEFFEMPVTSDTDPSSRKSPAAYTPAHMDMNGATPMDMVRALLRRHIESGMKDGAEVLTIVAHGTNAADFGASQLAKRMDDMLDAVRSVVEADFGLALVPATIGGVHEAADAVWASRNQ